MNVCNHESTLCGVYEGIHGKFNWVYTLVYYIAFNCIEFHCLRYENGMVLHCITLVHAWYCIVFYCITKPSTYV